MKKKELIELLEPFGDDDEIVVAPMPGITGCVNDFSKRIYKADPTDNFDAVVLSLKEEMAAPDELMLRQIGGS